LVRVSKGLAGKRELSELLCVISRSNGLSQWCMTQLLVCGFFHSPEF
jgi:hypothetical protein